MTVRKKGFDAGTLKTRMGCLIRNWSSDSEVRKLLRRIPMRTSESKELQQ
jgi:hypothetical protein